MMLRHQIQQSAGDVNFHWKSSPQGAHVCWGKGLLLKLSRACLCCCGSVFMPFLILSYFWVSSSLLSLLFFLEKL